MKNARTQDRVNCDIILNKIENGTMNICRATNISLGGMRMQRLLEPLVERQKNVQLEIGLPGEGEPLKIGAKKVYDCDEFIGVRFTDISYQHFVRLRSWLESQNIAQNLPMFG